MGPRIRRRFLLIPSVVGSSFQMGPRIRRRSLLRAPPDPLSDGAEDPAAPLFPRAAPALAAEPSQSLLDRAHVRAAEQVHVHEQEVKLVKRHPLVVAGGE